ncbi:MAG: choice-of-anchor D domain-containing protein [Myxococcales bacterium]|jgi:hypothetical protein
MRKLFWLAAALLLPACDCGGSQIEGRAAVIELGGDLQFGTISVGKTVTLALKVSNAGNATLTVERFEAAAPFSVSAEVPLVLLAGEEATIQVTYAPTEPNADANENHVGELVAVNDSDEPEAKVRLIGHAVKPKLVFTPRALDFGEVEAGGIKDLSLTVANQGTEQVVIKEARLDSDVFSGELRKLETTLLPGSQVSARFSYAPIAGRQDEVSLILVTDMHLQPEVPFVLRGTGKAAQLTLCYALEGAEQVCLPREDSSGNLLYAGELDFGALDADGPSSQKATVTISNEGNTQVPLVGLLTGGKMAEDVTARRNPCGVATPTADFTFAPPSFGAKLPEDPTEAEPNPPRSQSIEVTYKPHHECPNDLTDTATILVRAGVGAAAKTFQLDLRGASRVGLVYTENVFFQVDRPEQRPYLVYNTGPGPLQVSAVEIVEGDEGANNPYTDCSQRCADRNPCAGSTAVECEAFTWADGPNALEIAPGTSEGRTAGEVGVLEINPPPACSDLDPEPPDCGPIFKACARIVSSDPYRPVVCAELRGRRLNPAP